MLVKMEIASFSVDPAQNFPVLVLKESSGERKLNVTIGVFEANAIALKSLNLNSDRPLTIDLTKVMLEKLGGILERVVIYDYRKQIFYARLHLSTEQGGVVIDCRPSDGIGLGIRCGAPLFVEESVFEKCGMGDTLSEKETIRTYIRSMDTVAFGTYYLD